MEISAEANSAGRSGTLMLHLLGRCNLQCLHCYMEGSPSREERLPVNAVLKAIAECKDLGIGSIYVTGGEPLLYRELYDVLDAAAEVPGLQITLCTNGTSITQHHVTFLQKINAKVNISIDGEEAFHDYFRNLSGAFRASEKSAQMMAEAGIPITIVTTISQGNFHSLSRLVEWASSFAKGFRVQPLLRLGRGIQIADQSLTTTQMNQLLLQLSDLTNQYRPTGLICNLIGVSRKFLLAHPCGAYVCNGSGCHRSVAKEIKKIVIREDGTILPEVTNLNHKFALGKIGDDSLSSQVNRFFEGNGYNQFDQLCRTTYAEVLPKWESEVVPWDQIVAERSHKWIPLQTIDDNSSVHKGCLESCH